MTTSFECLSRTDRRPATPFRSLIFLVVVVLGLGSQVWSLKRQIAAESEKLDKAREELRQETSELAERARKSLPQASEIASVRKRVEMHNRAMIGPRSTFFRLFSRLEEWLPDGAVVVQLDSLRDGRPVPILLPDDRLFRLLVIFTDFPALSAFYRLLAQDKNLSRLFFQRKGRKDWLGRQGEAVEFTFRLEEP